MKSESHSMRETALVLTCLVLVAGAVSSPVSAKGRARYSVPTSKMDAALGCAYNSVSGAFGSGDSLSGIGKAQPVLLVHGTGVNREQNWEWNYWPALLAEGFEVCWVQLPSGSVGDIQITSEYVARAIEVMHRATGEKIDVLGHSQGGLQPRWAIKWFPSGDKVDDYVSLATPNHGTYMAGHRSLTAGCFASCWQMQIDSNFLTALNDEDETPGKTSYTNIYTLTDELVQPVGTQALEGASNILIQDLCPGRPVDHLGIAGDYVTWELVLDAFLNPGGADPKSRSATACTQALLPGASYPDDMGPDYTQEGEITSEEPPLMPYAR